MRDTRYEIRDTRYGFSLTEVLLAIGVLTVGMIFIAGVFPVAIHFTTIATERTTAAIVADEAFAKVRLYAIGDSNTAIDDDIDLSNIEPNELKDFNDSDIFPATTDIDANEFTYPSDTNIDISKKQYFWSALCRRINDSSVVQVTVFVSRRTSPNLQYRKPPLGVGTIGYPMPVKVNVTGTAGNNELTITGDKTFINDGYIIVDNQAGRIYRVLERYADPNDDTILLDKAWDSKSDSPVWVVPPPVNGGRYPCIAVYQKLIRF